MTSRSMVMAITMVAAVGGVAFAGQAKKGATAAKAPAARGAQTTSAANPNKAKLRTPAALNEKAPDTFLAKFDTSRGVFVVEVHRDWAPNGADRFYNLVKNGWYDDVRFFRVLEGFMAQFGMSADPSLQKIWGNNNIKDDPMTKQSNKRGIVTFAQASVPNSRSTQVFINLVDNTFLDPQNFVPFGQIVTGMDVVDKLYTGYGRNNVPDQGRITNEGNAYLQKEYPKLDYVKKATIEKAAPPA